MMTGDLFDLMKIKPGGYDIYIFRGHKRMKTQYSLFKQAIGA